MRRELRLRLTSAILTIGLAAVLSAGCATPATQAPQNSAANNSSLVDQRCPSGTNSCGPAFGQPLPPRVEPADRFGSLLDVIGKAVEGKTATMDVANGLQSEDIRRVTLLLQALYKEYLDIPLSKGDLKTMEKGRESIKALEDAVGQRTRVNDLIATATVGGGSPELIEILKRDSAQAEKDYIRDLRKSGWLPDPREELKSLRDALNDVDYAKKKKDQKQQVEALIQLADGFRADGKAMDKYFKPKDFSTKDLDNGLHALRRNLRWITAAIQASTGLYAYTTGAKSPRLAELEVKYGAQKYAKLAPPAKGSYLIDRETMLLLTKFVAELGALKDFKEGELDLTDVINKNDLAKNAGQAEKMAFAIMTKKLGPIDVENQARAIYAEYLKTDPLKRLKEDLQAQLDGEPVDND